MADMVLMKFIRRDGETVTFVLDELGHTFFRNSFFSLSEFLKENKHPLSMKINKMKVIDIERLADRIRGMVYHKNKTVGKVTMTDEELLFDYTALFLIYLMQQTEVGENNYKDFLKRKPPGMPAISYEKYIESVLEIFENISGFYMYHLDDYAPFHYRRNYLEKEFANADIEN